MSAGAADLPLGAAARRAGIAAGGVALVAGALTLNRDLVGVFYDDGVYAAIAWALAHGHGYVYANLPGAPAAIHYPPLYSAVLAPLFGFLSLAGAALAGKLLNVVCAAAACGLIAWHATRTELVGAGAPRWLAGVVVAAAALAIPFLTMLVALLSEPLFGLLLVAAVILADRPPPRLASGSAALLAGGAAALALLTRALGVAAGAGVVAWLYAARRGNVAQARPDPWRQATLASLPLVAAGAGWGAWLLTQGHALDPLLATDYGSYFELLRAAGAGALGSRTADLARPLGVLTLNWVPSRLVYYLVGVPALVVGVYGLACVARRSAIGVTLVVYLAILACWPVPPDRFLWAVLPWLALAWAAGAVALWPRPRLRVPVALLAAALVAGYVRYETRGFAGRWWELSAQRISHTFAEVLPTLDSLPPDAVIASDHDPLVWLYTRRVAVPLYISSYWGAHVIEPPPPVHRAYLERQGVTHVLLAGNQADGKEELERLLATYPGWLGIVRRWPDGATIFVVHRAR